VYKYVVPFGSRILCCPRLVEDTVLSLRMVEFKQPNNKEFSFKTLIYVYKYVVPFGLISIFAIKKTMSFSTNQMHFHVDSLSLFSP